MSEVEFIETLKDFPIYANKLIKVLEDLDDDKAQNLAKELHASRKSYYYYKKQYADESKRTDKVTSKFMLVIHNGYLLCGEAKRRVANTSFEGDDE